MSEIERTTTVAAVAAAAATQVEPKLCHQEKENKEPEEQTGGQYSDRQSIDAECEKLLRNAKKQVKRMMEEAVTKKFIHEESSCIMSLCVAVDACLLHGLKRRALGLFKTNSSTALIQKLAKSCKSAQEVLDRVGHEERIATGEQSKQQQQQRRLSSATTNSNSDNNQDSSSYNKSPIKQNTSSAHRRNLWIKYALIEKKLVGIIEHLAESANKYYEPEALMSNRVCAQVLSSLLVGPSALEFSKSKGNDCFQFQDPTADELLKRHKLANPIACLCNANNRQHQTNRQPPIGHSNQLARSATDGNTEQQQQQSVKTKITDLKSLSNSLGGASATSGTTTQAQAAEQTPDGQSEMKATSLAQDQQILARKESSRRRPLALKTSVKRGTLVTDCHHYSCQEISEHQQTRGYSFLCTTSNSHLSTVANGNHLATSDGNCCNGHQDSWPLWSPRMLHETLHQNSKSNLLYAKNNVLLDTQTNEAVAGYLSLHQTNSDLVLKWIPNQMINGSRVNDIGAGESSSQNQIEQANDKTLDCELVKDEKSGDAIAFSGRKLSHCEPPVAVESSCMDLVVSLSVSRIVLLHCQFGRSQMDAKNGAPAEMSTAFGEQQQRDIDSGMGAQEDLLATQTPPEISSRVTSSEETLILVEADGIQRAPFRFPKGGLRAFLSCLESGLRPGKFLDPAIKFDDGLESSFDSLTNTRTAEQSESPTLINNKTTTVSDSPSTTSAATSRLDSILRRLPSLKRRTSKSSKTSEIEAPDSSRTASPESMISSSDQQQMATKSQGLPTNNYVYRIVSTQQTDWSLQTPPNSALSVASSSSNSFGLTGGFRQSTSSDCNNTEGLKFRWSLSRLARFSGRYRNTSGSTSSTPACCSGQLNAIHSALNLNDDEICLNPHNQQTFENNSTSDNISLDQSSQTDSLIKHSDPNTTPNTAHQLEGQDANNQIRTNKSHIDFSRIEAKLYELKKSTSDDLMALRDQSIQTLCESMRKQIIARAFYGWLVHCRRMRIIRAHLLRLIKSNNELSYLIDESVCDDLDQIGQLKAGLTRERWEMLMKKRRDFTELEMSRQVNQLVYYGGVESDELRREVWPYLLEHYRFKDSKAKRRARDAKVRESYRLCGQDWIKIERVVKQRDSEILAANMAKASGRNVRATDSNLSQDEDINNNDTNASHDFDENDDDEDEVGSNNNTNGIKSEKTDDDCEQNSSAARANDLAGNAVAMETVHVDERRRSEPGANNQLSSQAELSKGVVSRIKKGSDVKELAIKRRKRRARLESTGSVGSDASITDQFGNNIHRIDKDVQRCDRNFWYFKETKNLEKLRNIMCSYVWQHLDVGYVQGMCDLAAPFLVIFDDEILAFSCFSLLMKRMVSNFPHDCAMDQHFESLKYLMQILDPKLFEVLQSNGDYTHFYFCYRWLLLDFKRELVYKDVYRVWETIWSARKIATDHFVVFMALAMVRYYRDIIIENNMDFTDTIKFFNEMAERHDTQSIIRLARDCVVELRNLIRN